MSYPRILGHEKVKEFFVRSIQNQRLSHAYVFYGPPGVGKFLFATELAKAIQCLEGDGDPCGDCASCHKVDHGNHPDIAVFRPPEGKRSIPIASVRDIQREIAYKPLEGPFRIALVDEAHKMTAEAANGFLKTLEEPSSQVILILVTESLSSLLDTVLSRCQRVKFPPLEHKWVEQYLVEEGGQDKSTAAFYASISMGSIERALNMSEDGWLGRRDSLVEIIRDVATRDSLEISERVLALIAGENTSQARQNLIELWNVWATLVRDMVVLSTSPEGVLVHGDRADDLADMATDLTVDQWLDLQELISRYRDQVERNLGLDLLVDNFCLDLADMGGEGNY